MPTPSEKKALLFLASIALLGASVRALRAVGTIEKVPLSNVQALDGQLAAVDSARGAVKAKAKAKKGKGRHRLSPADTMPASDTMPALTKPNVTPPRVSSSSRIDVDVATAEQLDALPGVGPVLARRIVADRNAHGPFGSLANLRNVKGIGPALAAKLDSLVTFSATPRPLSATPTDSSDTERRSARQGRRAIRAPAPPPAPAPFPRPRLSLPESWPHRSSPSSESAISSSVRGSSRANSSRVRSRSSGRTGRASDTTSSSSGSSKKTS